MQMYCLKILFVLFFVFIVTIRAVAVNKTIEPQENSINAIYKQFLKMRTLPFEDCGSVFEILYVSIGTGASACTSIPCNMKRGSEALVNVKFDDYGRNTSFLKHHVSWIFNAIRSSAIITPDPCDGDHRCLTNNSDGKSYYATVFVSNYLPCMGGTMVWEALDQYNQTLICFRIPVVITQ